MRFSLIKFIRRHCCAAYACVCRAVDKRYSLCLPIKTKDAQMTKTIIEITPKSDEVTYVDLIDKMHEMEIFEKFNIFQITMPAYSFRHEFLEHIAEYGLSSLFNFNIVMEDITSPSMSINDIEKVAIKFIEKLQGAKKKLVIIDPYFFSKSTNTDVAQLFSRLLSQISSDLEEICFITNGRKNEARSGILSVIDQKIKVHHVTTDVFHDRYWIDPDNNKGIIMGTSLNGLGNKISLIDRIREEDVAEIAKLAKQEGSPI
jgi:hypothetical protein